MATKPPKPKGRIARQSPAEREVRVVGKSMVERAKGRDQQARRSKEEPDADLAAPDQPEGNEGEDDREEGARGASELGEDELMEMFRIQHAEGVAGWADQNQREEEDEAHLWDDPWTPDERIDREGRPTLSIPLLREGHNELWNKMRDNLPAPLFEADDDEAHEDTAKVIAGLWRRDNARSNGNEHRMTAASFQIGCGRGYYGLAIRGQLGTSKARFVIEPVEDREAVIEDPHFSQPDASDRRYWGLVDSLAKEEFEDRYPEAISELGPEMQGVWLQRYADKRVPIVTWWFRKRTGWTEEGEPIYSVGGFKTQGHEILIKRDGESERWEWPGQYIPKILVRGQVHRRKRKWVYEGIVRRAWDSAKFADYTFSKAAEAVGFSTISQWLGAVGSFNTDKKKWNTANKVAHPNLQYDVITKGQQIVERPERIDPPPPPQEALSLLDLAKRNVMEAVVGQAAQGQATNDPSGYALEQRRQESDQAQAGHYMAGMALAILCEGKIYEDACAAVYGVARKERILGEDGAVTSVSLGKRQRDPAKPEASWPEPDADGKIVRHYDLKVGKHGVRVQIGPNFATKREEAKAGMDSLFVKADPVERAILMTIYPKLAGWDGHEKIARAFMAVVQQQAPAAAQALQDSPDSMDSKAEAAQLKQQNLQLQQVAQQMSQALQALQAKVQDKNTAHLVDLLIQSSKEAIEGKKTIAQVTSATMAADAHLTGKRLDHAHELHRMASEAKLDADAQASGVGQAAQGLAAQSAGEGASAGPTQPQPQAGA